MSLHQRLVSIIRGIKINISVCSNFYILWSKQSEKLYSTNNSSIFIIVVIAVNVVLM